MQTLFDENGVLNISNILVEDPRYKAIMEDGIVTEDELTAQYKQVLSSLEHLRDICNDEQQAAVLRAITDLSVYNAAFHNYQLQQIRM